VTQGPSDGYAGRTQGVIEERRGGVSGGAPSQTEGSHRVAVYGPRLVQVEPLMSYRELQPLPVEM
jgi:hypothetical protein